MNRGEVFAQLDVAIQRRNAVLAERLRIGLTERVILRRLKGVSGELQPLLDLYSWHDGTEPVRTVSGAIFNLSFDELAFFPGTRFHFLQLDMAAARFGMWAEAAKRRPELRSGAGGLFPLFWNGDAKYLTVDVHAAGKERVVYFDSRSGEPYVDAYSSFNDFLDDALRANERNQKLQFFAKE